MDMYQKRKARQEMKANETKEEAKSNININWYPGHMAKAKREITEILPLVDIVLELRDARIPFSSKNPMIDDILKNKPRLILLNKATLADPRDTKAWIEALTKDSTYALDIDSISGYNMKQIQPFIKKILAPKLEAYAKKGLVNKSLRALVVGIPNVGKSTFINFMAKKKVAKTGDKPGVTKTQTWLKISDSLQILDTPGILWPKFESQDVGIKLSICGSIKDEIVDLHMVALYALNIIEHKYPTLLEQRYGISIDDFKDDPDGMKVASLIAAKRGCLLKGNQYDYERVFTLVMNDIRSNRIGAMTFESAN